MKAIFSNLGCFKEYDNVLADLYGHLDATYNLGYLFDSLKTLNNVLSCGTKLSVNYFDRDCLTKLEMIIEIIATDIRNGTIESSQLKLNEIEFGAALKEFTSNIGKAHLQERNERNEKLAQFTNLLIADVDEKIDHAIQYRRQLVSGQQISTIVILTSYSQEVKCFSDYRFPNGDNRMFDLKADATLLELIMMVNQIITYNRWRTGISYPPFV